MAFPYHLEVVVLVALILLILLEDPSSVKLYPGTSKIAFVVAPDTYPDPNV